MIRLGEAAAPIASLVDQLIERNKVVSRRAVR
jgi:hypothetical protein